MFRRILKSKREERTSKWMKLNNEGLNDLYSAPNIVRVIKSRRMSLEVHVARNGWLRGVHRVLVGKTEGKRSFGKSGVNGKKIGWIVGKRDVGYGLDRAGSGWRDFAGICECCNELSDSIKCGELLV